MTHRYTYYGQTLRYTDVPGSLYPGTKISMYRRTEYQKGSAAVLRTSIRRTSSEVAGRAEQRAQNLAWLGGEASPPSAEPRLCRRPPLPLPPSTAPFRHFVAPKFNATFFAPKNHQKAPTWIPKWSRGDHLELHGRAQTSKNKQKH